LLEARTKEKFKTLTIDHQQDYTRRMTELNNYIASMSTNDISTEADKITDLLKIWQGLDDLLGASFFTITSNESSHMDFFLNNYVNQFKTILTFIRATRECNIILHLEATRNLLKYFFANNNLSYARLQSIYLSTMEEIRQSEPKIWNEMLEGNLFSVSKSGTAFSTIGPDHAHEQEIKIIKGQGGVVGITQKEECLDRFFTIAPELTNICNKFENLFLINDLINESHHDITGSSTQKRIEANKNKLVNIFQAYSIFDCCQPKQITNMFTLERIDDKIADDIIKRDAIGEQICSNFIEERLVKGNKSIWDPMTKSNIATFSKTVKIKQSKNSAVKVNENYMQKFVIANRTRTDINLKEAISNYEFSSIPKSLFASAGIMFLAHAIEKICETNQQTTS
jgi:hypothetical protein